MATFLIIISALLWAVTLFTILRRTAIAPVLSFVALFLLSLARRDGYQLLPINSVILSGWFAMTLIVTVAAMLQPETLRRQTRGMGYILAGAVTGLAVGLLGSTAGFSMTLLYGVMIIAVAAGIFLGFLLYTRTPDGSPVRPGSGNFFRYLLAKGFPAAIAVMQLGIPLLLLILLRQPN